MGTQRLLRNFTSTALPMLERLIFDFIYLFLFRWLKLCSVSVTWLLMWTGYFLICKACFDSSSRSEPSNTHSFRYWGSYILLSTIEIKLWVQQIKIHFLIFWMFLVFTQFCLIFRDFVNYCIRGSSSWDGGVNKKSEKSVTLKRNRWWNIL